MTKTMSAADVQDHFDDLMRDVSERGETILVERSGEPQVVLLSLDEFKRMGGRTEEPEDWRELLDRTRESIAQSRRGKPLPDPSEIIHQMREERDAQLLSTFYDRAGHPANDDTDNTS